MQAAEAEEAAAAEAAARRERVRRGKEAGLPAEPPADSAEPLVTCLFRFPDGGRHSRRFPLGAPLQVGGLVRLWWWGRDGWNCVMQAVAAQLAAHICCCLCRNVQNACPAGAFAPPISTPASPLPPHRPALQLLFDFVDSKGASGLDPGSYALVTQFPRRVFLPPAGGEGSGSDAAAAAAAQSGEQQQEGPATLAAAGLSDPREVLFLEHRGSSSGGEDATAPTAAAATAAAGMQ